MRKAVLLVILAFTSPYTASAWNGKGHEVVCYIVYQHLDSAARARNGE
jgi:hypothetical protein